MTKKIDMSHARYYDRRRAAEYRGVSLSTIIRDEKDEDGHGLLTPVRFKKGGKVFYRAEEVEAPPKFT